MAPQEIFCSATIEFGDDFGDNEATFHCSLPAGHEGPHAERGDMAYKEELSKPYRIEWEDEHPRGEIRFRIEADASKDTQTVTATAKGTDKE